MMPAFLLPPKPKSNMLDYQILGFALGIEHHSGSPGLFTFDSESKGLVDRLPAQNEGPACSL